MDNLLAKLFIKDYKNTKSPAVREAYGTLAGYVGICVNVILSAIKLVLGLLSSSVAIMADALNNLSDAGSSIITIVSFKIASKPADREHPFGHARFEYIASMIISFLILLVGVEMISDSVTSLFDISWEKTPISIITVSLLSVSVVMKLLLGFYYRKIGKTIDSGTIAASAADSFTDAISTLAVLICNIIISFTGWGFIDSIAGAVISVFIIIAGIKILLETKNFLIGNAPVENTIVEIKEIVSRYPEILSVHDLMVHNYGPGHFIASFHAEVDGKGNIYDLHDTIDNVERCISDELGILCTIHMDPIITDDPIVNELNAIVTGVINEIRPDISIHDFRVVTGTTHTNLIFDVVIPFEFKEPEDALISKIKQKVSEKNPTFFCVITVDRG